jgi:hypothetical protein
MKYSTIRFFLLISIVILITLILIDSKYSIKGLKSITHIFSIIMIICTYAIGQIKKKD